MPLEPVPPRTMAALLTPVVLIVGFGVMLMSHSAQLLGWWRVPFIACVAIVQCGQWLSAWPGVLGFFVARRATPSTHAGKAARTAIVMPIYHEDVARVFVTAEQLARSAVLIDDAHVFILSDSQDLKIVQAEQAAFDHVSGHDLPISYRQRICNDGRKAGNIAEFCQCWGGEYDFMIVLDADSLMTTDAMRRLIAEMVVRERAGIIQTVPYAVNRETLFARWQQWAGRMYTPAWAHGSALWQGDAGNYWGHNAIVRIAPFMAHCALPILRGRPPLGGEILCHDVVEAALMRRAGWEVLLLPDIEGSYEELPANLIDHLDRERRWCQGNLQHGKLLGTRGFALASRMHLASGLLYYLSSLAWIGIVLPLLIRPEARIMLAPCLAALCLIATLLPKLIALASRGIGRTADHPIALPRLAVSALADLASGLLIAPIMTVFAIRFIFATLTGGIVRWDSQPRDDRGLSWSEATRRLGLTTLIGGAGMVIIIAQGTSGWLWGLFGLGGLLASIPFAVLGSRKIAHEAIFVTEDEVSAHPELALLRRSLAQRSQIGSFSLSTKAA